MIPHHVHYQLATLEHPWLCIMLHAGWLSRSTMAHQKPTEFVLPHASLRQFLLVPEADQGQQISQTVPAVYTSHSAGLTDHVWTLQEVLLYPVPPWPQSHAV